MIVDAMLLADPVLDISGCIDDGERYMNCTDSVLREIEKSTAEVGVVICVAMCTWLRCPLHCVILPTSGAETGARTYQAIAQAAALQVRGSVCAAGRAGACINGRIGDTGEDPCVSRARCRTEGGWCNLSNNGFYTCVYQSPL